MTESRDALAPGGPMTAEKLLDIAGTLDDLVALVNRVEFVGGDQSKLRPMLEWLNGTSQQDDLRRWAAELTAFDARLAPLREALAAEVHTWMSADLTQPDASMRRILAAQEGIIAAARALCELPEQERA